MKYSEDNRRRRKVVDLIYFKERWILVLHLFLAFGGDSVQFDIILNQVSFLLSHREKKMHISLHISFHCNFSNKFECNFSEVSSLLSFWEKKKKMHSPNFYGKSSLLCIVIFHRPDAWWVQMQMTGRKRDVLLIYIPSDLPIISLPLDFDNKIQNDNEILFGRFRV